MRNCSLPDQADEPWLKLLFLNLRCFLVFLLMCIPDLGFRFTPEEPTFKESSMLGVSFGFTFFFFLSAWLLVDILLWPRLVLSIDSTHRAASPIFTLLLVVKDPS